MFSRLVRPRRLIPPLPPMRLSPVARPWEGRKSMMLGLDLLVGLSLKSSPASAFASDRPTLLSLGLAVDMDCLIRWDVVDDGFLREACSDTVSAMPGVLIYFVPDAAGELTVGLGSTTFDVASLHRHLWLLSEGHQAHVLLQSSVDLHPD